MDQKPETLERHIIWITAAFYALAIALYSMVTPWSRDVGAPAEDNPMLVSNAVAIFVICLIGYWCIFVLIHWRHKDEASHNWRVWAAWSCITVPIVLILVALTGNEIPFGGNLFPIAYAMLAISSFFLSPIATLFGAMIGQDLFNEHEARIYRRSHNDEGAAGPL